MSHDEDAAAELARRVRARAAERGDAATELRATLELGQALLRSPLGESFGGAAIEVDLDGAEEAYRRAIELAEQLDDDRSLAAALREIGMIDFARGRAWFAGRGPGRPRERAAGGCRRRAPTSRTSCSRRRSARCSSRRPRSSSGRSASSSGSVTAPGVMSTVIAMAYARYGPVMHLSSSARHLEEIRRVTSRLSELVTESERDRLDLQMLFGVHVYSRAKVVPDLALSRGEDAHRAARLQGDRTIEFLAAGGVAMSLLELGDVDGAERWLGLAAGGGVHGPVAQRARPARDLARHGPGGRGRRGGHAPPPRARRRDGDRGRPGVRAVRGPGPPGARGVLAWSSGDRRPARRRADPALVELVERSAAQVKELLPLLPGHAPWGAQADAALATVALARGDIEAAAMAGGAALEALQAGLHEDTSLEILIPAARAVFAGAPPEVQAFVRGYLQSTLSRIAQGTADETIRVRWLTRAGRARAGRAGRPDGRTGPRRLRAPRVRRRRRRPSLDEHERRLLQLLTEGRTNAEIAAELDLHRGRRRPASGPTVRPPRDLEPRRGDLARVPRARGGRVALMAIRARVDRHKCIGAGNCITLAPTAFDWLAGDYGKADVVGPDSVDEEVLRAAAFACPTAAIILEDVAELLPWQLRGKAGPARRVMKTFMFTDIVGSTNLVEALGDEAWETILRWHNTALREVFAAHGGEEISTTGDGFFVSFDSPDLAVAAAIAIQRRLAEHRSTQGFAPQVRIGLHASDATQVGGDFHGKGVHEAARIAALGGAGDIVASVATVGESHRTSEPPERDAQGPVRADRGRERRLALTRWPASIQGRNAAAVPPDAKTETTSMTKPAIALGRDPRLVPWPTSESRRRRPRGALARGSIRSSSPISPATYGRRLARRCW